MVAGRWVQQTLLCFLEVRELGFKAKSGRSGSGFWDLVREKEEESVLALLIHLYMRLRLTDLGR